MTMFKVEGQVVGETGKGIVCLQVRGSLSKCHTSVHRRERKIEVSFSAGNVLEEGELQKGTPL